MEEHLKVKGQMWKFEKFYLMEKCDLMTVQGQPIQYYNDVYEFNTDNIAWKQLGSEVFSTPRCCIGVTSVNEKLYIFGGYQNGKVK